MALKLHTVLSDGSPNPTPTTTSEPHSPRLCPAAAARAMAARSPEPTAAASTDPDPEAAPSPMVWASHIAKPAVEAAATATGPTRPSQPPPASHSRMYRVGLTMNS